MWYCCRVNIITKIRKTVPFQLRMPNESSEKVDIIIMIIVTTISRNVSHLAHSVVLSVNEGEHLSYESPVVDEVGLGPRDHRSRDQLGHVIWEREHTS